MSKSLKLACAGIVLGIVGAPQADAALFNGWSAGASVGWERSNVTLQSSQSLGGDSTKANGNGVGFGLFVNWAKSQPHNLYLAAELGLGFSTTKPSKNGTTLSGSYNYNQKRSFSLEFTPKLGYNFGPGIAYALVSVRGTQVKNETSFNSGAQKANVSQFLPAFGLGAGGEMRLSDRVSAGLEYKYFFENSTDATVLPVGGPNKVTYKTRTQEVKVRLSYFFCS